MTPTERGAWLTALYTPHPHGSDGDRSAARRAFLAVDELLRAGKIEQVAALMKDADVSCLSPSVILSLLTATLHAKRILANRPAFVESCEARLVECLGAERAERLLRGRR